jgi:hypothetical protein
MKTISEIRKTATVLDRKALKSLLGGAGCAAGETKIRCSITDEGGTYTAYLCHSGSAKSLQKQVKAATLDAHSEFDCAPA